MKKTHAILLLTALGLTALAGCGNTNTNHGKSQSDNSSSSVPPSSVEKYHAVRLANASEAVCDLVPEEGQEASLVLEGTSFRFHLAMKADYSHKSNLMVKANGAVLTADEQGVYTIDEVTADVEVVVYCDVDVYRVTFYGEDGTTVYAAENVAPGGSVKNVPADPSKADTNDPVGEEGTTQRHHWTWDGWYTDLTAGEKLTSFADIHSDLSLYARFDSENIYRVALNNADGLTLRAAENYQAGYVLDGDAFVYTATYVTKTSQKRNAAGLLGELISTSEDGLTDTYQIAEVHEDMEIKPTVDLNQYTITFHNGDTVLGTKEVIHGEKITYDGNTPTKDSDASYDYTFDGWLDGAEGTSAIAKLPYCFGAHDYYAHFASKAYFAVALPESTDGYIVAAIEGQNPSHVSDGSSFSFSVTPNGGATSVHVEVAGAIVDQGTGNTFKIRKVSGNIAADAFTVTATNKVKFLGADGAVIASKDAEWNKSGITFEGSNPTKDSDASNDYAFDGWTCEALGDTVYTADTLAQIVVSQDLVFSPHFAATAFYTVALPSGDGYTAAVASGYNANHVVTGSAFAFTLTPSDVDDELSVAIAGKTENTDFTVAKADGVYTVTVNSVTASIASGDIAVTVKKPLETATTTEATDGVLGDGITVDTTKISRVDQSTSSDARGGTPEYISINKGGAKVNALHFSQSKPAISYWAKTDGNKDTYPTGSGSYNNNGYSEFRFAKKFGSEITGTMSVELDYALTNTNVTTPAAVEAAKAGASGKDARENDGTYVAQYAAKMTADGGTWPNGANLDEANYRAGENGYTVEGFLINDGAWHHVKIERAIVSDDGTVTFKFYHWVGEIALTNVTITATATAAE